MSHGAMPVRAVLTVVASALGFSLISIFSVLASRAGTPLAMQMLGRYVLASLVLLPSLRWLGNHPTDGSRLWPLLVVGGVGQAFVATLSLSALAWIPAATLVFLFYTYPGWVTLIAAVRRLEPLDGRKIGSLGLSLLGVATIVGLPGAASAHPVGVALALTSALVYAVYVPLMGHLQRGIDPTLTSLLIAAGVSVIFVAATLARGEFDLHLPLVSWGAIVGLALICTAAAFRLFLHGLAQLGPVRTSIISTVEPLFAAVLANLVLGQPITAGVIVGGVLILSAVLLLQAGRSRGSPPPTA